IRVLIGREPADLVAELPVVPKDRLLQAESPAVTPEGYGYDPQRGELWFAGETAEAVLIELDARRRALAEETAGVERRAAEAVEGRRWAAGQAGGLRAASGRELERLGGGPVRTAAGDADELRRDLAAAREALAGAERAAAEAEADARRAQAELAEAAPVRRIAVAPRTLELLVTQAERLDEALVAAARATARYEAPL